VANEIWLGPLLGAQRSDLVQRCADLTAAGKADRFLYLAASHPLLELVTEQILDGARNPGLWGELPVYLFRGFVRRVLAGAVAVETGMRLPPRVPIDREELPLKHSLVSQVLARLNEMGRLKAIGPLAGREGCVNTIATLLGEIERSAKSPEEVAAIIAARSSDLAAGNAAHPETLRGPHSQIDFDREVGLIYATYCDLLNRQQLTEQDADQLRALGVLRGELEGQMLAVPWLAKVELLVLDGFFDFTPVQGELLQQLIPRIPETIVNLNHDDRNPEIFAPFQETIDRLTAIAPFAVKRSAEEITPTDGVLARLRENLFNPKLADAVPPPGEAGHEASPAEPTAVQAEIRYFECGDRDTELRAIAREVKQLVLREGYQLAQIALVVRQRAAYAETIARVMREEAVPCSLEARIAANDIPANRAALKLFKMLEELARDESAKPRVSAFADLIKSEYFRFSKKDLAGLTAQFDANFARLLEENEQTPNQEQTARLKQRYRVGLWDPDALENAFAYVGSELRVSDWLTRARKLITELPGATATRALLNIDSAEQARDPDEADQIENAETAKLEAADAERKRRPARDLHPATLAWTSLVLQAFAEKIDAVARQGEPLRLRQAVLQLLEELSFHKQLTRPIRSVTEDDELPHAMLNYNSLEALRRAFAAAIKSIEIAATIQSATSAPRLSEPSASAGGRSAPSGPVTISLATFLEEVRRSLSAQSMVFGTADRGGLRVLEATDVRGLRFRAVFIAGLVEGGFPLRAMRDWIYPHEERERLKRYGLTLEDISPATLLKEEHYFYQAACRATGRLYLSRPLQLADDSETVASYYLDELRRAVAPFAIPAETIRSDYEGKYLDRASTAGALTVGLVRQQERYSHRGEKRTLLPLPRLKTLLTLARNDRLLSDSALRRIEIERERASTHFGPYDGEITEPHLLALLRQRFGADFVHSASGLSIYGNCAYRFFGQRVLRLEPRGEAALDLQAIDAGKLLHDILRRFFEQHRRQRLSTLDRAALQQELRDLADHVFDEHEQVVPPLNKQIWKIDREIRKILLDQVLVYELEIQEEAAAAGTLPAYFEIAFGGTKSAVRDPYSKDEPLELTRTTFVGEETIKISGQIDRVDLATDNTLIAYDYKLSTGASKEDIKSGRSLQLPIYLEALERLILPGQRIAGGGYYVIRGGNDRRNKGLHRATALEYSGIGKKAGAVMGDDEWQQIRSTVIAKVWDFLDGLRAGQFVVNPAEKKKTCRFCDFAAVCRYDRFRIDGKNAATESADSTG
jgi:ATP-dependent helicase/DNAse subunit B